MRPATAGTAGGCQLRRARSLRASLHSSRGPRARLLDVGAVFDVAGFVSDGTNVYYPANFSTISAVPVEGGAVKDLAADPTQFVSLHDHHLYYAVDGCAATGTPGCPAMIDYDLATATSRSYDAPVFSLAVVGTATALYGFSIEDVLHVDRASGAAADACARSTTRPRPAVLGTHAFYAGSDYSAQRYELTTGTIDAALPAVAQGHQPSPRMAHRSSRPRRSRSW